MKSSAKSFLAYDVELNGLAPCLFQRPVKDQKTPKTERDRKKQALQNYYHNGKGIYVPDKIIKATCVHGIRLQKLKLEKSMTRAIDLFKTLVQIKPKEILFIVNKPKTFLTEDDLHECPMVLDQGKMNWKFYPKLDLPWALQFQMIFHEMLDAQFIKDALVAGGLLAGIGSRPHEFGKFEVVSFNAL